jgi:hypothetical protein
MSGGRVTGMFGPTMTRASFLKGGIATAAAALWDARRGALLAQDVVPSASLKPSALHFAIVAQSRPFDLLPSAFEQFQTWFAGGAGQQPDIQIEGDASRVALTYSGSGLAIRSTAAEPTLFSTDTRPVAPFATMAVTLAAPFSGARGGGTLLVGLVRDDENYVLACFDLGRGAAAATVSIAVSVGGQSSPFASRSADLTGRMRFALSINENYAVAFAGDAAEWWPLTRHRTTDSVDFRKPSVLQGFRYGFGVGGADAIFALERAEAGYFGELGIRDPHIVSYADGRPYIAGNKLYFTATHAGLHAFDAAHWGVWTLDLDQPGKIQQSAKLFFARNGRVLGDHAGQIVLDESTGDSHVLVSGWGDFDYNGVHVHFAHATRDLLHGVNVVESARMPLPTELSSWDPTFVRIDGVWNVGFVESPYQDTTRGFNFRPVLARGESGGGLASLRRVGADLTRTQTEGTVFQKFGREWFLLASDGLERRYRVYDLAMRLVGFLDAPYRSNIPHPGIVPVPSGVDTEYLMLTFDGTPLFADLLGYGTHGDFILMRASEKLAGHAFQQSR